MKKNIIEYQKKKINDEDIDYDLKEETYIKLFNKDGEDINNRVIILSLESLFSSDYIINLKDCELNMKELNIIKNAISKSDISQKAKDSWNCIVEKGIQILNKHYKLNIIKNAISISNISQKAKDSWNCIVEREVYEF